MSKTAKIWLIIAGSLTALGILIFVGAMAMCNWSFSNFGNAKYTTKTYEVNELFDNISIDVPSCDINFVLSKNGQCKVDCYDTEKAEYSATVKDKTLTVTTSDEDSSWTDRLSSFSLESPKMTVYLPENEYKQLSITTATGDVNLPADFSFDGVDVDCSTSDVDCSASAVKDMKIHSTTGDVNLSSLSADNVDISVTTGDVALEGIKTKGDLSVKTTSGDISLTDTISEKSFSLEGVTCDVIFDKCDAAQITATTTTGDITGTLRSDKSFTATSSSGDVDIPNPCEGGKCELTANTGDINIRIDNSETAESKTENTETAKNTTEKSKTEKNTTEKSKTDNVKKDK